MKGIQLGNCQNHQSHQQLGQTMTDEMAKEWDAMGLTESMQIERLQDWANMMEKRVAEFDPLYRAYPWGRKSI